MMPFSSWVIKTWWDDQPINKPQKSKVLFQLYMACNPVFDRLLSRMANQVTTYRNKESRICKNLATWMIIQIDLKGR